MKHPNNKNTYIRIVLLILLMLTLFYTGRIVVGVIELTKLNQNSAITDPNQLTYSDKLNAYALAMPWENITPIYDQNGVVVVDYSKTTIQGLHSIEYNPGAIAQFSLAFYNQYQLTGSEEYREHFLTQLDWLVTHYVDDPSHQSAVWKYEFEVPQHGVNYTGWASGLAQGVAISALLRGYQMMGNEEYLSVAEKAVNSMVVPVDQGGVAFLNGDDLFFEEVPSANHILNGDVFALLGVYEYWLVTDSDAAKDMVDKNITTLKKWLPQYDLGYWSRYSLDKETFGNHYTIASPGYHDLHIDMLELLYVISGDTYFADMKAQWEKDQIGIPAYFISASRVIYADYQFLFK